MDFPTWQCLAEPPATESSVIGNDMVRYYFLLSNLLHLLKLSFFTFLVWQHRGSHARAIMLSNAVYSLTSQDCLFVRIHWLNSADI